MPRSQCHFYGQSRALCVYGYPHHLWQRCQAGTYCLGTHLPPAHHPCLHWLHLQRGLQHFQPTLFVSGPISHLHWPWIWLGTHLGTHCHCQTQNPIPMNLMSSNDSLLICAQMLNSHQKRRSQTVSTVEKGIWCICAWKKSIQQSKNWREDHPMGVFQHLLRSVWVLWRWRWTHLSLL